MTEMVKPIAKDMVPFINLTENPQVWAGDFLKMEAAEAEYLKLKSEYENIKKAPQAKEDQIKFLKTAYDEYQKNTVNHLAQCLSDYGTDAIFRLPHLQNNPINSIIPPETFLAALKKLPPDPDNALTDEQRRRKLNSIKKEMDSAKSKIKKYSPQAYFQFKNGNVKCDARREFVSFWRNKQAWIARPCCPRGIDLEYSSEDIRWLHHKLAIGNAILDKARKLPFSPR